MRMKTTILYAIVINPVIGYCDSNLPFSIGLKKDTDQARIFFSDADAVQICGNIQSTQ